MIKSLLLYPSLSSPEESLDFRLDYGPGPYPLVLGGGLSPTKEDPPSDTDPSGYVEPNPRSWGNGPVRRLANIYLVGRNWWSLTRCVTGPLSSTSPLQTPLPGPGTPSLDPRELDPSRVEVWTEETGRDEGVRRPL